MKHSSTLAYTLATLLLASSANAHYIFSKLVLNGVESKDWEYIRQTTRSICYMPTKYTKTYDNLTPDDSDFRCNLGSFSNAAKTKVAEVAAGDTIAMKLFYDGSIAHPGPGQVFMSKASSGDVTTYEGDGDWFKIFEQTICNEGGDLTKDAWCAWGQSQFEFQIPADTPAGEYLVRAEHVGLHGAQVNEAEFFYSCAQLKVTGSGTGTASTTFKIPGIYNDNMKIFNGINLWTDSASTVLAAIDDTPLNAKYIWSGVSSTSSNSSSTAATSSASATMAKTTTGFTTVPTPTGTGLSLWGGWGTSPKPWGSNSWNKRAAMLGKAKH